MKRAVVAALLLYVAGDPAYAGEQTPAARRQVAPLIRALTNCVAQQVLADDVGTMAYRDGTLNAYAVRMIGRCNDFVSDLVHVYDRVSGEGEGMAFLNGPYSDDLPRAVLKRIKPQLDAKLVEFNRVAAEELAVATQKRAAAEAQDKAEQEAQADEDRRQAAERRTRIAEAEQRAAAAKAAASQAEADAKAAASRAEAARQQQIGDAKKAETLLIDRAAECSRKQLISLVKSGESAEVLASAVMTICSSDVTAALDAGVVEFKLEHDMPSSDVGEGIYREKMRAEAKETIVALAVQAKAGVGSFAPASSN